MGLKIGVIGPAGFGGSFLCVELLRRGHSVHGISRHPERLGQHALYTPHSIDIVTCSMESLIEAFRGFDVLVNEYGPHTSGENALQYQPFVELTRKIIIAVKESQVGYFIMVGGCGSLNMPGTRLRTCCESKDWWLAYRRGIADSHAHVSYMESRLGSMGTSLRTYRDARIKLRQGEATADDLDAIDKYEKAVLENDKALTFVTACRTTFTFFDGNESFHWSYVSPSALYRSGKRTSSYEVVFDELPVKPAPEGANATNLEGRLHGITAANLAIAIADEAESQKKPYRHWSAYGDLSDDTPGPSYITLTGDE